MTVSDAGGSAGPEARLEAPERVRDRLAVERLGRRAHVSALLGRVLLRELQRERGLPGDPCMELLQLGDAQSEVFPSCRSQLVDRRRDRPVELQGRMPD